MQEVVDGRKQGFAATVKPGFGQDRPKGRTCFAEDDCEEEEKEVGGGGVKEWSRAVGVPFMSAQITHD